MIPNHKKEINSITFNSWHNVILMRSDSNFIYLMLYGTKDLKEGNYSIANDFHLRCYSISDSNVNRDITIPISAITITRHEWGFKLQLDRTKITDISDGSYDGIAIAYSGNLTLKST